MKIRFNRILTYLCAVMMTVCIVFTYAGAESDPATPTDLEPQETGEAVESLEVMITKVLKVGESWSGTMKKTKPTILKLDIAAPQTIYILAEGKDVWFTAEKSDRTTDKPTRTLTDKETNEGVITLSAEEGSYLITAGPVEPNLMAKATISVMNEKDYEAWEKAKEEADAESREETQAEEAETQNEEPVTEETEASDETEAAENEEAAGETEASEEAEASDETEAAENEEAADETETEETADPEEENAEPQEESVARDVKITISWDEEKPAFGSIAHFDAAMTGYENLEYELQWQWSADKETWNDVEGATTERMDVTYSPENGDYHWRLMVYVVMPEEAE